MPVLNSARWENYYHNFFKYPTSFILFLHACVEIFTCFFNLSSHIHNFIFPGNLSILLSVKFHNYASCWQK
jgi:hypothetical protein